MFVLGTLLLVVGAGYASLRFGLLTALTVCLNVLIAGLLVTACDQLALDPVAFLRTLRPGPPAPPTDPPSEAP